MLPTIEQNLEFCRVRSTAQVLKEIFTRLTGHHIAEAAQLAIENDLPQLGLILSQTPSTRSKNLMQTQLNHWIESDCLKHIDEVVVKIYMLLAGVPVCEKINVCQNIDWLRVLAMHLWYVLPYHVDLVQAVNLYEKAFSEERYAKKPHPPYNTDDRSKTYDIIYHLLRLYSNKELTLNQILDPATHTSDFTDYRLSWLMLQALTALNVGVMTENGKNHVHVSFANQLEQMGHWKHAVFVLLFIKNVSVKRNLVLGVLERNLPVDGDEYKSAEEFLINQLNLPPAWIHTVMADKCRTAGNYCGEFQHSLHVGRYDRAHRLAMGHIVPHLLNNKEFELARSLLMRFEGHESTIQKWQYEGGLLLWFLTVREVVTTGGLRSRETAARMQHDLVELCQKVKYFPRHTSELSVCISEVSKACGVLLQVLLRKLDKYSDDKVSSNALSVEDLVMPPDYKLIDLDTCISDYFDIDPNSMQ